MAEIKITKLDKRDIDAILNLESHSAPKKPTYAKYDRESLEFIFDNSESCSAFGLMDNSKLIGWSSYRANWNKDNKSDGTYEMSSLVIHKDYRRVGLGLKLFNKRLKDILSKPNVKTIYATAYPKNTPIILLYLNHGFEIYDFKKNVYGKGADRIYLKYNNS